MCVCVCAPPLHPPTHHNFGMRSERKRTDFHLSSPFEKKKNLLAIQIYALATSPPLSLSLSCLSLLAVQVASADDQGMGSLRGRGGDGGGTEGKKEKEGASASHFTFPQHHPSVPASLQSVLL